MVTVDLENSGSASGSNSGSSSSPCKQCSLQLHEPPGTADIIVHNPATHQWTASKTEAMHHFQHA